MELLERRYNLLRTISHDQPIGRRLLAEKMGVGERIIRGEIDFLKSQQLLSSDASGVYLAPDCEILLSELGSLVHKFQGLSALEIYLAEKLNLDRVYIVPGDADEDPGILSELGKLAGRFIQDVVQDNWVIAVTGGTTMAEVARHIPKITGKKRVIVVPGRGGLGEDVEIQANTVAARIAHKLGAIYRMLHIPDSVRSEGLKKLLQDPKVQEIITLSKQAQLFLHGIGVPEVMASRREQDWEGLKSLAAQKPVGEALGNYFAADGSVVLATTTVGPRQEDLKKLNLVVAVAGGRRKGKAITAVLKGGFTDILITDQGAAQVMKESLEGETQVPR